MSTYSKSVSLVLKEVEKLIPQHGPYSSLHDMKFAFQHGHTPDFSYKDLAVSKKIVEELQIDGVKLADVTELLAIHKAHCQLIQTYMSARLSADASLTVAGLADEIRSLITSEKLPESAQGNPQEEIYAAEISILDTAFVFTPSRLEAASALISANVPPALAFSTIDQSHGDVVSAMPASLRMIKDRITSIIVTITFEQKLTEVHYVMEDLLSVLEGKMPSSFSFKTDYEQAMRSLNELIGSKFQGISPRELVKGICTPEFLQAMKDEVKRAKETYADGLIMESIGDHLKLEGNISDSMRVMYDEKMAKLYYDIFVPWRLNSSYLPPKPVCHSVQMVELPGITSADQLTIADSTNGFTRYKDMGIGAGTALLLLIAYNKLAPVVYENIVKPVKSTTWNACNRLGMLLFSSNNSESLSLDVPTESGAFLLPVYSNNNQTTKRK